MHRVPHVPRGHGPGLHFPEHCEEWGNGCLLLPNLSIRRIDKFAFTEEL